MLSDIEFAESNKDFRIGYRIINNNLAEAKPLMLAIVEALYCFELKLKSKTTKGDEVVNATDDSLNDTDLFK